MPMIFWRHWGTKPQPCKNHLCGRNPEESAILEVLSGEAMEIDKIVAATGLAAAKVLSALTVLEIKGSN